MTWKNPEGQPPPLCRYCGKAIRKRTSSWHFGASIESRAEWFNRIPIKPLDLAEARRQVGNLQVVSVRWTRPEGAAAWIDKATAWDGESYEDGFFCNGEHARFFGYAAARKGLAMPDYNAAVKARNEGKK
jgi:hypothetical protein